MDYITHVEFADRLEKIMEPLISCPSFKAKISFFHGDMSGYNPYGTDRLHGAKAYIRALSKVLANADKVDALNEKTPSIDLACAAMYLENIYNALDNGRPRMTLKNPVEDSQFLLYAFEDVWAYVRARL